MEVKTEYVVVREFIEELCRHYRIDNVPVVEVVTGNNGVVSGFCSHNALTGEVKKIFLRMDPKRSMEAVKHGVMHEFAHALSIKPYLDKSGKTKYRSGHTDDFYNVLWSMVKWSGINQKDSFGLEIDYKPRRARKMAILHGIKGASNA